MDIDDQDQDQDQRGERCEGVSRTDVDVLRDFAAAAGALPKLGKACDKLRRAANAEDVSRRRLVAALRSGQPGAGR